MAEDKVIIKNIKLEYINTKTDNYNNNQVYLKVLKGHENKFTAINKDGYHVPYFKTNDNTMFLKVKSKYVKIDDLNKDMTYICDLELKHYKMDESEGWYVSSLK